MALKKNYLYCFSILMLSFVYNNVFGLDVAGTFRGVSNSDRFGSVISSIGDINKDGYEDFAVGAPGDYRSSDYNGKAYIFFGGQKLNKYSIVLSGEKAGDRFGISASSVGDINKDGYGDFAIGADRNDEAGTDAGKIYIYLGGTKIDTIPYKTILGERTNDYFGISMAGGNDINRDGEQDFLVSGGYAGKKYAGAVYVYLSGNIEKPATILEGEYSGDMFGSPICITDDLDGDKVNDIVVSSYYCAINGKSGSGKVYIYKGGDIISPKADYVINGIGEKGWFGYSTAGLNDINNDGLNEFAISAPKTDEGYVYIFNIKNLDKPLLKLKGSYDRDLFGYGLANCGDQNADGITDLVIGSPNNSEGLYHSGKADVFYVNNSMDNIGDARIMGVDRNEENGYTIANIKNFYGKDKNLILIGCPFTEANAPGQIRSYK